MQLTKKQLNEIIAEEMQRVRNEPDELETLLESYAADYDADDTTVSKEALIDFLEVMEESRIPVAALSAFMENMPEQAVMPLLKEVVEED